MHVCVTASDPRDEPSDRESMGWRDVMMTVTRARGGDDDDDECVMMVT